jgi:DNA polymerase-3 subunit alpha
MKPSEILEKLVRSRLKITPRIETELANLANAPDFIPDAFLKAYKYVVLDGNEAHSVNECHSLIAYELGITKTHPGQISFHYPVEPGALPDIDTDFAYPDRVKKYLKEKYGEDKVVGIPTYGRYRTRALLTDLCRVVTDENKNRIVSIEEVKALTKKLPFKIDQQVSSDMVEDDADSDIDELFSNVDIQEFQKKHPSIFEHFQKLYALPKYRGSHAAGIVILPEAASDTLPLAPNSKGVTTEWTEGQGISELGSVGVIKIDILGLKTLKILDTCNKLIMSRYEIDENTPSPCACRKQKIPCEANNKIPFTIRETTGETLIDFNSLCLNMPKVYNAIGNNENQGVFQFEPEGISAFAKHYGPKRFMDLALITALYRPGPLDARLDQLGIPIDPEKPEYKRAKSAAMVFVDRHKGHSEVFYPSAKVEKILEDSYGICVFQENLSQMIMALTSCSFAEAEKIRKFLTKVKPEALRSDAGKIAELQAYEDKFTAQAKANGCNTQEIEAVWNLIVPFARYGFVKSHAVAYSLISFQTAFCRAEFPLEYLTALMIHNVDNTDKLVEYIRTAQKLGIKVLPPDLNSSLENFSINDNNEILCGLEFIKGVGEKASAQIVNNRKEFGPFTSLDDFLSRKIAWRNVDVGVLEVLTKCGALESFSENRALTLAKIMIAKGKKKRAEFETVDMFTDGENPEQGELYVKEWDAKEKSNFERECFGFLLEDYIVKNKNDISRAVELIKASNVGMKQQTTVGTIDEIKLGTQKNNEQYARISATNFDGIKENWLIFASYWNVFKNIAKTNETYLCFGKKDDKGTFIVEKMTPMNDILY